MGGVGVMPYLLTPAGTKPKQKLVGAASKTAPLLSGLNNLHSKRFRREYKGWYWNPVEWRELHTKSLKYVLAILIVLLSTLTLYWSYQLTHLPDVKQDFSLAWEKYHTKNKALGRFYAHYRCPAINYSLTKDYIDAARQYNLDYRLLPAISIAESSCFRHYRYQNGFGWNSANSGFGSIQDSIYYIAGQLANGKPYAGKSLLRKLQTYNPPSVNPRYAYNVMEIMNQIKWRN